MSACKAAHMQRTAMHNAPSPHTDTSTTTHTYTLTQPNRLVLLLGLLPPRRMASRQP